MLATIGRALLWGLAGAVLSPVLVGVAMIVVYRLSPACGSAGDSGGCEMGVFAAVIASVPIGAGLLFAVALIRGVWRRFRARRGLQSV